MRHPTKLLMLVVPVAASLGVAPPDVKKIEITEWLVPWADSRPRDPYVDGQGRVWFVGQTADYLAFLDPKSGEFKRFDLDPGAGPHNLIVDKKGIVWYAGNRAAHIGKLDPQTGKITKYPMPDAGAPDPHTLIFGKKEDIWFTVQGGNFVGKLLTSTGEVRLVKVPTLRARPYGIVVDAAGRPWFNEFGANKLGTVDPETMDLEEIALPHAEARGRRIGLTADGAIWYVDYARGHLGRFDPRSRSFEECPVPGGGEARPYGMAVDDRDRIWFVETGAEPNRFVGFDPKTKEFFSITEIRSQGGAVRHMFFHRPTRAVWFGTDTNTIRRASVP